jgi:formylglycine-generating enzyme required for sulfatase activity
MEPHSGIEFTLVPAGRFTMGSPPGEPGREPQEVPHEVVISRAFYLGTFEVTQQQWERVMGSNPSWFRSCGPECPVERVSWYDVQSFIARLGALSAHRFRLPTEAEWEYACRAGTTTPFNTGRNLSTAEANYDGEAPYDGAPRGLYRRSPIRVGRFAPNGFGLHDMHGNVWEWTQDWSCPYPAEAVTDPVGACPSGLKVIRGGSWYFDANSARSALRYTHRPQDSGFSLGFRLVRPVEG